MAAAFLRSLWGKREETLERELCFRYNNIDKVSKIVSFPLERFSLTGVERQLNWKKHQKRRTAAAVLCAASLFFSFPVPLNRSVSAASSATTTVYLNLRDSASMSGRVLTTLSTGTQLTVLDNSNAEWVKVRTSSGLEGWCSREYLSMAGSNPSGSVSMTPGSTAVTTAYLNLRQAAGTSATILTTMPKGAIVSVLENPSNGWVKVRTASGLEGYCSTEYLSVNAASDSTGSGSGSGSSSTITVAVTTANLKLRTGPAVSYTALVTMPQGTKLTVVDNSNAGWAKVQTPDGKTGWCSKEFLTITTEAGSSDSTSSAPASSAPASSAPASSAPASSSASSGTPIGPKPDPSEPSGTEKTTATTTANLKLRTGPGTNYDMILILANGTELTVTDNSDPGWAKVRTASGKEGWCSKEYLRIVTTGGGSSGGSTGDSSSSGSSSSSSSSSGSSDPDHTIVGAVVNADALRLRAQKSTSSAILATLPKGTQVSVLDASDPEWIQVKTTSGLTGYMSAEYLTLRYSDDPETTLPSGNITLSNTTGTVAQGKTLYLKASGVSSVSWSSSNTTVATVENGFVEALSPGTAVITASYGSSSASCTVTVTQSQGIRTAYTSPNIAAVGQSVNLIAVTDADCDAVRFYITETNGSTRTVEATSSATETVTVSGKTYTTKKWTASAVFQGTGKIPVKAVASRNGSWGSVTFETSAFISSTADRRQSTSEERRASDEMIQMIANWEGYASTVYADTLTTTGVPTIGYGYTFGAGSTFYNHISKTEAWSLLVNRINEGSYTSEVNKFIKNNKLLMNQNQADCLISFGYNVGAGYWNSTATMDVRTIMLNAVVPPTIPSQGLAAKISKKTSLYQTTSRTSSVVAELALNTSVTVLESNFANIQDGWYRVRTSSGQEGWVNSGYITFQDQSGLVHDLNYTNAYAFGTDLIRWNMAGGKPYAGLFYRRLGEANVYNYNDYSAVRYNKYGYTYPSAFAGYN